MLRLQFFRARLLVSSARAFSSSAARPSFISRKDNQDLPSTTQGHAVDKDDPKDVQSENARAGIEDKKNQRTSAAASAQGEDKKPGSETASPNKAPGYVSPIENATIYMMLMLLQGWCHRNAG
ncbi:hypothetical protein SAICODRAFT_127383 [Saitoella complicata NRRL Y-17804]|uniref:uncharacterized protein n=1 Tax=Saitoella complicata (strain BCRC 22490 / CBS 7301 / JCM 7358 / NBRC 10748 / NRRL Y-17804) TaxID=698492 RepID=UPI000867FE9A|nr:uncharacterized protein SAICODRAFT_127383 [Saitoella complicata NRRL Y-17804]ODQ52785.1 hypothetical protein SAICODRAFT_127383 [Saitoella complicata NRRL Y-17804]